MDPGADFFSGGFRDPLYSSRLRRRLRRRAPHYNSQIPIVIKLWCVVVDSSIDRILPEGVCMDASWPGVVISYTRVHIKTPCLRQLFAEENDRLLPPPCFPPKHNKHLAVLPPPKPPRLTTSAQYLRVHTCAGSRSVPATNLESAAEGGQNQRQSVHRGRFWGSLVMAAESNTVI